MSSLFAFRWELNYHYYKSTHCILYIYDSNILREHGKIRVISMLQMVYPSWDDEALHQPCPLKQLGQVHVYACREYK